MSNECIICYENCDFKLHCDHNAHKECLTKWFKITNDHKCPYCQKPTDLFKFVLSSDFSLIDLINEEGELTPNIKKIILLLYKINKETFEELVSVVLSSFHSSFHKDMFNFMMEENMVIKNDTPAAYHCKQSWSCAHSKSPSLCIGHRCNKEESFTQPFDLCDGHRCNYRIRSSYLCESCDKWIANDHGFVHCCCYLLYDKCLI